MRAGVVSRWSLVWSLVVGRRLSVVGRGSSSSSDPWRSGSTSCKVFVNRKRPRT